MGHVYVSARPEVYCSVLANVKVNESASASQLEHENENANHQGKWAANMYC